MMCLVVKVLCVSNAHENDVIDACLLGGVNGTLPLGNLRVNAFFCRTKEVRQHKDLFRLGLREGAIEVRALRVIRKDVCGADGGKVARLRSRCSINVTFGLCKRETDIAADLAARSQHQHVFYGHGGGIQLRKAW